MRDVIEAIKNWIILKFEPHESLHVSEKEMIHYLQAELAQARIRESKLLEVIAQMGAATQIPVKEPDINLADLKPIGGHNKPWSVVKRERERESFLKQQELLKQQHDQRVAANGGVAIPHVGPMAESEVTRLEEELLGVDD